MHSLPKIKALLLATLLLPIYLFVPVFAFHSTVDSTFGPSARVDGNLDPALENFYPFEKEPMSLGFSQYGELISMESGTTDAAGTGQEIAIGLQYPRGGDYDQTGGSSGSRDPFANENVARQFWYNGWFLYCSYRLAGTGDTPPDRKVWAFAMFADGTTYGGEWRVHQTDTSTPQAGGRQTSGFADTEPMTVLYDGPRRFVAVLTTHLYDSHNQNGTWVDWPMVDLVITILFSKVTKEVTLIKEVGLTIDAQSLDGPMDCQLSNREQWILGPSPTLASYAHYYHQMLPTTLGEEWTTVDTVLRSSIEAFIAGSSQTDFYLRYPPVALSEKVYVNGVFQPRTAYQILGSSLTPRRNRNGVPVDDMLRFSDPLTSGDLVFVQYSYDKWWEAECTQALQPSAPDPCPGAWTDDPLTPWKEDPHLWKLAVSSTGAGRNHIPYFPHWYDVAQFISTDEAFVGWAAMWPVTSDFTVDGWDQPNLFQPLVQVRNTDMRPYSSEPDIPFLIGQWDVLLDYEPSSPWPKHFRAVEKKGVTRYHDALDEHMVSPVTPQTDLAYGVDLLLDREVLFYNDENFNSWDIWDALHKETKRWMHLFRGDGMVTQFCLDQTREEEAGNEIPTHPALWDVRPNTSELEFIERARSLNPYVFQLNVSGWSQYSSSNERVLIDGVLQIPERELNSYPPWGTPPDAEYSYAPDTHCILFKNPPGQGAVVKVLWSSVHQEIKGERWNYDEVGAENRFLLNDDIVPRLKPLSEVFIIGHTPIDVAFLIDDTFSMFDDIGAIKADIDTIIDAVEATSGGDARYSVTAFTDAGSDLRLAWTTNNALARSTILDLFPAGGDGCPESSDVALGETVTGIYIGPWRGDEAFKLIVLFTDAPPGGLDDVMDPADIANFKANADTAAAAGIVISTIQGATICDDQITDVFANAAGNTTDVLAYAAGRTGGRYVKVDGQPAAEAALQALPTEVLIMTSGDFVTINVTTDNYHIVLRDPLEPESHSYDLNANKWGPGARFNVSYTENVTNKAIVDSFTAADSMDGWDGIHPVRPEFATTVFSLSAIPKPGAPPAAKIITLWGDEIPLERGDFLIHETAWGSELILDEPLRTGQELKIAYEVPGGRYEWTAVGRDAHSIDSEGAAMINSAIKSRNMDTGLPAGDMSLAEFDPAPSILAKFGAGDARADYMTTEDRVAFLDGWSTLFEEEDFVGWPIETSNIIISGGPLANMAQRYFNDFNEAFFGISTYAGAGIGGKIIALTAWSKGGARPPVLYEASGEIGYGVICTYKDKEGTVGLSIWGYTGRDTYFTAQWFEFNKFKLQHISRQVACIIEQIDYTTPPHEPTAEIIHWLGTISEKAPTEDP